MNVNQKGNSTTHEEDRMPSWREVFLYFLMLGFINIGGPVAQITMMYNHMVERRHWLSEDRFVKITAFCHMLPGPEALQLAIYVGYLRRKLVGGIFAGLTFILPGALIMVILSWLYVTYGNLPQVNNVLYVLKPAVLGIIGAGILKLGRASIRNFFLGVLLIGAFVGMRFAGINFLLILLLAGVLNLLVAQAWPTFWVNERHYRHRSVFSSCCCPSPTRAGFRWPGCF
jgi:chromate transporter